MRFLVKIVQFFRRIYRGVQIVILKSSWRTSGKHVRFFPGDSYFHYGNISLGDDVYIGPRAMFISSDSTITIGNKVMFGPGVTISTGDHNISRPGVFIKDNLVKDPENDLPVVIEDDVWIGSNVIILKGITIRRGSVVAAGSLVTKNVPPYCIYGGLPAKMMKHRFTQSEVMAHEQVLYSPDKQLLPDDLIHLPL
jgi:acetyltransferase-like isoleucine patch superfamily enzyme